MLMGSGAEIQLADHQTVGEVRVMQFDLVSAKSSCCFTIYQATQDAQMFTMLACCFLYHVHSNAAPGVRRIKNKARKI